MQHKIGHIPHLSVVYDLFKPITLLNRQSNPVIMFQGEWEQDKIQYREILTTGKACFTFISIIYCDYALLTAGVIFAFLAEFAYRFNRS